MTSYLPPLQIHVVSTAEFSQGELWSEHLQQWFSGDREVYAVPEPNIPVLVWEGSEQAPPPDIGWDEAQHTALILLVDAWMVGSQVWRTWATRQATRRRPGDLFLPCVVSPNFVNLGEPVRMLNAIRLDRLEETQREGNLLLLVTHALSRWYLEQQRRGRRVRLFISHATGGSSSGVSGRDLALQLKEFLDRNSAGQRFFDEVDITGGEDFERVLEEAIRESVIIVLLTDVFSSRFWCGWEVTTAKQMHRPVIVVDALERGEPFSLAYLGKTPTLRWNPATLELRKDAATHRRIIAAALLEQLRLAHDESRLNQIHSLTRREEIHSCVAARPPELATLPAPVPGGQKTLLLHTDPPLPRYELTLIQRQRPDLHLASATQALAGYHAGSFPLRGMRIAISISDPPDRKAQGMTRNAQERLWTQLATHLILAGAELAYGGDLREGGYTDQLLDMALSSAEAGRHLPEGIVHWYAGWPVAARLTPEERARLPGAFNLHTFSLPKGIPADPNWSASDLDPVHRFAWTVGMSELRRAMAEGCSARLLVGGAFHSVSPWPGLLEEFETFVSKPIYLLGGFGGMARVIIQALQGGSPAELTEAFQDDDGRRSAVRIHYNEQAREGLVPNLKPIDWPARLEAIQRLGVKGLNNGLSDEENQRLFVTRSLTEMIALVLEGLRRVAGDMKA